VHKSSIWDWLKVQYEAATREEGVLKSWAGAWREIEISWGGGKLPVTYSG
jgi:hypothetical protein